MMTLLEDSTIFVGGAPVDPCGEILAESRAVTARPNKKGCIAAARSGASKCTHEQNERWPEVTRSSILPLRGRDRTRFRIARFAPGGARVRTQPAHDVDRLAPFAGRTDSFLGHHVFRVSK